MPFKTDKEKLNDLFLKRNVKLLPCQKEMVRWWYENSDLSITKIAKLFKVNKRTIQFLLFPERLKRNKELREKRGGTKIYYDKDYHNLKMKEHRQYKNKTFKKK